MNVGMKNISEAEKDAIEIIKYIFSSGAEKPEISEWNEAEAVLAEQAVKYLPADYISEFVLSEEKRLKYNIECANNIRKFHKILEEQDTLGKVLAGIDFVVLNGTAAAMNYPRPELRQMGDIDILVRPEEHERAAALLSTAGYSRQTENYRHTVFNSPTGTHIELHRKFASSDNNDQNETLDGMLLEAIASHEVADVCGHRVPVLPKTENGLVLLGHINQHISSGLGLRQITDWMLYVRRNLTDALWEESFRKAADAIGMRKLAEVTTLMCKRYLGLEGVTWCDCAEEELADELLEYILRKGNFGRNADKGSRSTLTVMHKLRNPVKALRYLNECGMINWKAAQKHRILRPFAWIYQTVRYIRKGLKRKVKASTFVKEARQSSEEMKLLEKLEVTRE